MDPAAGKLKDRKWQDAMPSEQKALQNLLRAEATFRQIEVAFGSRGGGGGGGGAGRDLASLFDLELDTQKNQYETAQTAGASTPKDQQVDDALKKLDDLARRQEELAQQQSNNSAQSIQDRWQQELLRRNAEELQRQLQQLAQNNQQQGGQQSGQQGDQQSQQAGQQSSGQSGQQSSGQSGQQGGGQRAVNKVAGRGQGRRDNPGTIHREPLLRPAAKQPDRRLNNFAKRPMTCCAARLRNSKVRLTRAPRPSVFGKPPTFWAARSRSKLRGVSMPWLGKRTG